MTNELKRSVDLNRYEKFMAESSQILGPIFADVSKESRVSKNFSNQHQQTIWDTGSNIIGPTFFMFVWWVLKRAQQLNIKRLYFLARDGQIFLQIAELIKEKYSMDVECRYLYGSRQAWLVPSIKDINQAELDWILSDWWYELTINSMCKRLGFSSSDISELLTQKGFDLNSLDQKLSNQDKEKVKEFLKSKEFHLWFNQKFDADFKNTLGYFKQEGLLDDVSYGLVDVGWRGNQQVTLNKILIKSGCKLKQEMVGFYIGMIGLSHSAREILKNNFQTFLFDITSSLKGASLVNNHLYEAFAASSEPRTVGFKFEQGKYVPVLANQSNQQIIDWGIDIQRESIISFSKTFLKDCPIDLLEEKNCFPVLKKILYQFIVEPTIAEANTYGKFPMDGEMTESNVQEVASIVTRSQFWGMCFNLKKFNLFWVQASLIRSSLFFEFTLWKILLPVLMFIYFNINRFFKK